MVDYLPDNVYVTKESTHPRWQSNQLIKHLMSDVSLSIYGIPNIDSDSREYVSNAGKTNMTALSTHI